MLSIRLSRIGKKKMPYFRLIVSDKRKDPWGTFLENLGHYNPRSKEIQLKIDRIKFWLDKGAQPSNTVHNLFVSQKIIDAKKVRVTSLSRKNKKKLEGKKTAEDAATAAKAEKTETPAPVATTPEATPEATPDKSIKQ